MNSKLCKTSYFSLSGPCGEAKKWAGDFTYLLTLPLTQSQSP